MLPNPKNTKSINNLLAKPSDPDINEAEINQKKLQAKRKAVAISLIFTAGLSFIFWGYKSIQSLAQSPQRFNFGLKFKLPKFSLPQNYRTDKPSSADIDKFLEKSLTRWSVFVSLDTDYSTPVFKYQTDLLGVINTNQIIEKIDKTKTSSQSLINLSLPQGLLFQETLDSSSTTFYHGLIHLPKNKILIIIKNENTINSVETQSEIPLLIEHLYWYAVNFLD